MNGKHPTGNGRGRRQAYLPPIVLQVTGLIVFVGVAVFWAITGHQSVLVMSAALSLTALGAYSGIHVSVKQDIDQNRKRRATDDAAGAPTGRELEPFE